MRIFIVCSEVFMPDRQEQFIFKFADPKLAGHASYAFGFPHFFELDDLHPDDPVAIWRLLPGKGKMPFRLKAISWASIQAAHLKHGEPSPDSFQASPEATSRVH